MCFKRAEKTSEQKQTSVSAVRAAHDDPFGRWRPLVAEVIMTREKQEVRRRRGDEVDGRFNRRHVKNYVRIFWIFSEI